MAYNCVPTALIRASNKALRPLLKATTPLRVFLAEADAQPLTTDERAQIVDRAIMMLEGFYVHLPLKRAMHAVDPVRRLRLLRHRLPDIRNDRQFHAEMIDIYSSLRDLHTNYVTPSPYQDAHAWLPFKVEAYAVKGARKNGAQPYKYIVSRIAHGFSFPNNPTFREGAEILYWNGAPIERAVELSARESAGANPAAQHALGVAQLTHRFLSVHPPPAEEWVTVTYRGPGARDDEEIRFEWVVTRFPPRKSNVQARTLAPEIQGLQLLRRIIFSPRFDDQDPFRVDRVRTPRGTYGYIRIFSFGDDGIEADKLVSKFRKHLERVKNTKGLIIDVRDNGGGHTRTAERLIQLLAPGRPRPRIEPEPLYFINTPYTLELCRLPPAATGLRLSPWIELIERSLQTGATFSASFPYTDPAACNNIASKYPAPVIVVTNALSYSATEFFSAGFQDHGGTILGVDDSTGGGGANVRSYMDMRAYFGGKPPFEKALPRAADIRIALRRSMRVRSQAGNEIEDFGVTPNSLYRMTRNDLLNKMNRNEDMKLHAIRLIDKLGKLQRGNRRRRKSASSRTSKRRSGKQ